MGSISRTRDGGNHPYQRILIGTLAQVAGWIVPQQGYHHMSLHPQILANAPIANRSGIFRMKALFCEQRAKESSESRSRSDWEELAIEWYTNLADGENRKGCESDVA